MGGIIKYMYMCMPVCTIIHVTAQGKITKQATVCTLNAVLIVTKSMAVRIIKQLLPPMAGLQTKEATTVSEISIPYKRRLFYEYLSRLKMC